MASALRRSCAVWALLAGVWALVLLGAAPAMPGGAACGAPSRPAHHTDAVACCPCALAGPAQALLSAPPTLPRPRGSTIGRAVAAAVRRPAPATLPPARARGPPAVA